MGEIFHFEVEEVANVSGHGVVLVRAIDDLNFTFTVDAKLAGCPVTGFDVPRQLGPDGQQRRDLFAFFLERVEDLPKFAKGRRVELSP